MNENTESKETDKTTDVPAVGVERGVMRKINLLVAVSPDDLVADLVTELTIEELLSIIKKIDIGVADWDFTNDLICYFREQEKIYVSEIMEHGA